MKKKNNKRYHFPSNNRTEFARFTEPDVFPADRDAEDDDRADDSFFHEDPPPAAPRPDVY